MFILICGDHQVQYIVYLSDFREMVRVRSSGDGGCKVKAFISAAKEKEKETEGGGGRIWVTMSQ